MANTKIHTAYKPSRKQTVGGQTVFSEVEEKCLALHIIAMSTYGFPATSSDLKLQAVPAANVWHYNEMNLVVDPGNKEILAKRGIKYLEQLRHATKACTSLMAGLITNNLKIGSSLFSPILKKTGCEGNIKFVALPPNSTHQLQPLDVAYFQPMKSYWWHVLAEWKNSVYGSKCSLQETRRAATQKTTRPRCKKFNVPPGKSIGSSDTGEGGVHTTISTACGNVEKQCRSCEVTLGGSASKHSKKGLMKVKEAVKHLPCTIPNEAFTMHDTDDSMDTNYFHEYLHEANEEITITDKTQIVSKADLLPGKFVLGSYEDNLYPGMITEKTAIGYMVSVIVKSKNIGNGLLFWMKLSIHWMKLSR
ncbi:hypothetical protein PR048_013813 [Dryococelus australis]|uniref:DDE-1 domain-containing protein n=1 Tax=Dryococelus australis TaxID=614101 RepID=A0ABQ9HT80_9NEOP|nr:hypothetical protein PR048_013813 [Dryococelus australis]